MFQVRKERAARYSQKSKLKMRVAEYSLQFEWSGEQYATPEIPYELPNEAPRVVHT